MILIVLVSACTGDITVAPAGRVARVEVEPEEALLTSAGATEQFVATVEDEGGRPITNAVVTWRSSDSGVAVVNPSTGLVTAVAEGSAVVTAEADGVTGEATVLVDIPDCAEPVPVSLAVGELLVAEPPVSATCALLLPSGSAGDRYRVAIVRLAAEAKDTTVSATLTLIGRGVTMATSPATPPPLALQARVGQPWFGVARTAPLDQAVRIARATGVAHARVRADEEMLLGRIGPGLLSMPPVARALAGPLAAAPLSRTFIARGPTETKCDNIPATVTGLLVAENTDVAVYQDSAQAAAKAVSAAHVQLVLDFYTAHGKPTIQSAFGAVPDGNGDGQVVVLVTPRVANQVAAFVWGGDLLPKTGSTFNCAASNEMELVYLNADILHNIGNENYQALETLVHEVKHIVSFSQRQVGGIFTLPPPWIEEGAAEIAGEIASRRAWASVGGPAQNATLTGASFGSKLVPESFGIALHVINAREYLSNQPNGVVAAPPDGAYSVYGSGWFFLRFLGDAYAGAASAPGADAPFFAQMTSAATAPGPSGLATLTGTTFSDLLIEYASAVILDGTGVSPPARAFTTYDIASVMGIDVGPDPPDAPFPYPVTAVGSDPSWSFQSGSWSGPIGNAGLRVHDFVSNGTGTHAEIVVQVGPPARLVIARLR